MNKENQASKILYDFDNKIKSSFSVKYAVYYSLVSDNFNYSGINENEKFHAASIFKSLLLVGVLIEVEHNNLSFDDKILIKNEFVSIIDRTFYTLHPDDDSEKNLYSRIGKNATIFELCELMIKNSSNLATNLLIELVTLSKLNDSFISIGINNSVIRRGVQDLKAFDMGINNYVTAKDIGKVFELAVKNQLFSESISKKYLEFHFRQELPGFFNNFEISNNCKVAYKTGSIAGIKHNAGLFVLPESSYVLVILISGLNDKNENEILLRFSQLSKEIFKYNTGL